MNSEIDVMARKWPTRSLDKMAVSRKTDGT